MANQPYAQIVLNGTRPATVAPDSLVVLQQEYGHDVVSAVIKGDTDWERIYQTGRPMVVTFGWTNNDVKVLYGYAHHNEPIMGPGGIGQAQALKFVGIGASYKLNDSAQQVWFGQTITAVVKSIAEIVRFSGQIWDYTQGAGSFSQDGLDYWSFLVQLAKRIGWTMYADNTDLHFHPYITDFGAMRDNAFQFGAGLVPQGKGGVVTFHAVGGETVPGAGVKRTRVLSGVDARTGDTYSLQSDVILPGGPMGSEVMPPMFISYEDTATDSLLEAASKLSGAVQANRWHIQAKAEVTGTPRVRPGTLVCFDGLGRRHDGYWYVQSVEHEIDGGQYRMFLGLGRDSEWDQFLRPDKKTRRVITTQFDQYGVRRGVVPPPVLVQGAWRAAYGAGIS